MRGDIWVWRCQDLLLDAENGWMACGYVSLENLRLRIALVVAKVGRWFSRSGGIADSEHAIR